MKLKGDTDQGDADALNEADLLKNFMNANEEFGNWPTTVWEVKDASVVDRALKSKRAGVGDAGAARGGKGVEQSYKSTVGQNTDGATTSIFPPRVAANILTMYAPKQGLVYDPFAGGGTRATMAATAGLDYLGVEIRKAEVDHLEALVEKRGLMDRVSIIHGDSRKANGIKDERADFLYTCPPYWNMEQYDGGPGDVSMMDLDGFIEAMNGIVGQCYRILKPGALACWVMGMHRMGKDMKLVPLHHYLAEMHTYAGFRFKEEIIIYRNNPIALQRVGNFKRGHKLLVRVHEYCLVFERI